VYLWGNDKSRVGEIIRSLGINVVLAYRALREKYEQVGGSVKSRPYCCFVPVASALHRLNTFP
jgi:hypothetical protein